MPKVKSSSLIDGHPVLTHSFFPVLGVYETMITLRLFLVFITQTYPLQNINLKQKKVAPTKLRFYDWNWTTSSVKT